LSQFTHYDSQAFLENCDDHFSDDPSLFYEEFQPPLHSYFDGHQTVVSLEQPEAHCAKQKCYHIETLGIDLQIKKKKHVLNMEEEFFSKPEAVPYILSSSLGDHVLFF
jgi:hypothetical protein